MKLGLRQIIAILPVLLFSIIVTAQDLPKMPADPAIVTGSLPNGLSYYVISNAAEKGMADFALIQKTGTGNIPDSSAVESVRRSARETLTSLVRLKNSSPQSFFVRHGAVPGKDGYVSVSDNASLFRFPAVRLSDGRDVLDSALVVLLNMADKASFSDDEFLKKWYSPADQAIVVAGDVDAKALVSRLEAMSYMVPSSPSQERKEVYLPDSSQVIITDISRSVRLKEVKMTWVSKRVPAEFMNTVQPVIFDRTMDILGKVMVRRMKAALAEEGIPAADISYGHKRTDEAPGDDVFSLNMAVSPDDLDRALEIMSGVVASIDMQGAALDEYLMAEADHMNGLKKMSCLPYRANEEYVDRCVASYLYGSHLSSMKQIYTFHTSRAVPDSLRCRLFNDVTSAMVHSADTGMVTSFVPSSAALTLPGPGLKIKVRSSRKDHLSGGSVWTFANGFKVVYRKMPTSGEVYYTLALNGGYSSIAGLENGEGAFVSDIFKLCRIGGVDGYEFFDRLAMEGLVMEPRVTMSNTLLEGHLDKDRIPLLMQSLLALTSGRIPSEETFDYYRKCENLSLEHPKNSYNERLTAIDNIMCPSFRYSPYKSKGNLSSSFYSKAYAFLDSQMQKLNDGVLVMVGDMDEEYLKQQLMLYVGGFRTKDVVVRKSAIQYQPVSGTTTYTVSGYSDAVDIALSARMPMTLSNYFAACVAVMNVERYLQETLAGSGMAFELYFNCRIYPEERINLLVSMYEADSEGLAYGHTGQRPIDALVHVREALTGLASKEITDEVLKQCKAYLKNKMDCQMKDPEYWLNAIVLRYLDGKDLTTGYAACIDALTKEDVKRVMKLIDNGCKVEYVTEK